MASTGECSPAPTLMVGVAGRAGRHEQVAMHTSVASVSSSIQSGDKKMGQEKSVCHRQQHPADLQISIWLHGHPGDYATGKLINDINHEDSRSVCAAVFDALCTLVLLCGALRSPSLHHLPHHAATILLRRTHPIPSHSSLRAPLPVAHTLARSRNSHPHARAHTTLSHTHTLSHTLTPSLLYTLYSPRAARSSRPRPPCSLRPPGPAWPPRPRPPGASRGVVVHPRSCPLLPSRALYSATITYVAATTCAAATATNTTATAIGGSSY